MWALLRDPGYKLHALLTTITDTYNRVSISGVREELLDGRAERLGLPLIKVRIPPACPNDLYEQRMASVLAAQEFRGIDHVAFSDLFLGTSAPIAKTASPKPASTASFPYGAATPRNSLRT